MSPSCCLGEGQLSGWSASSLRPPLRVCPPLCQPPLPTVFPGSPFQELFPFLCALPPIRAPTFPILCSHIPSVFSSAPSLPPLPSFPTPTRFELFLCFHPQESSGGWRLCWCPASPALSCLGFEPLISHCNCLRVRLPQHWRPRGSQISKVLVPPMGPVREHPTGPAASLSPGPHCRAHPPLGLGSPGKPFSPFLPWIWPQGTL